MNFEDERPRLYHWYSIKTSGFEHKMGQCLGVKKSTAIFRYHYLFGFYSTTSSMKDNVFEEVNDPRYAIRVAKWFAVHFLDLKFYDVRFK